MTRRKKSDFGGMLNKLAEIGFFEMHLRHGSRLRFRVFDGRIAFATVPNVQASGASANGGRAKRCRDESTGRDLRVAAR